MKVTQAILPGVNRAKLYEELRKRFRLLSKVIGTVDDLSCGLRDIESDLWTLGELLGLDPEKELSPAIGDFPSYDAMVAFEVRQHAEHSKRKRTAGPASMHYAVWRQGGLVYGTGSTVMAAIEDASSNGAEGAIEYFTGRGLEDGKLYVGGCSAALVDWVAEHGGDVSVVVEGRVLKLASEAEP